MPTNKIRKRCDVCKRRLIKDKMVSYGTYRYPIYKCEDCVKKVSKSQVNGHPKSPTTEVDGHQQKGGTNE